MTDNIDVRLWEYEGRDLLSVRAGRRKIEHVVPPAGEEYAFERVDWDHVIEVSVSPTGRSVQVWVDGERVLP